jgi:glycosyltransferase involved in cell wall biosynthesis
MYEDIDVALIPLKHGKFNSHKSELKLIEAGTTGCAAIVSNVEPYKAYLKDGYNCLTTSETNGWYRSMKRLINEPNLREDLAGNLALTIAENFNPAAESHKLTELISTL